MSMPLRVPSLDPTADVAMAPASNKTEDQVKHLLLQADPRKKFPELKYNMMADNLKTLKTTMTDADWKSFESWMHKWLLFEMAKNTKPKGRKTTAAKKDDAAVTTPATTVEPEMIFSGAEAVKLAV